MATIWVVIARELTWNKYPLINVFDFEDFAAALRLNYVFGRFLFTKYFLGKFAAWAPFPLLRLWRGLHMVQLCCTPTPSGGLVVPTLPFWWRWTLHVGVGPGGAGLGTSWLVWWATSMSISWFRGRLCKRFGPEFIEAPTTIPLKEFNATSFVWIGSFNNASRMPIPNVLIAGKERCKMRPSNGFVRIKRLPTMLSRCPILMPREPPFRLAWVNFAASCKPSGVVQSLTQILCGMSTSATLLPNLRRTTGPTFKSVKPNRPSKGCVAVLLASMAGLPMNWPVSLMKSLPR